MKQYFLKGVDEPLNYGDDIEFDLEKLGENNTKITKHVVCKFIPEIVPLLLDEEIIEEKEVEGKTEEDVTEEELNTFMSSLTDFIEETHSAVQSLLDRVNTLEKNVDSINDILKRLKRVTPPSCKNYDVFGFCF